MRCWPIWRQSAGSTSTSPAIISGIAIAALLLTGSGRCARQQETCRRPLPPERVPDLVLLIVLFCPFYVVTPKPATRAGVSKTAAECHPGLPRWANRHLPRAPLRRSLGHYATRAGPSCSL